MLIQSVKMGKWAPLLAGFLLASLFGSLLFSTSASAASWFDKNTIEDGGTKYVGPVARKSGGTIRRDITAYDPDKACSGYFYFSDGTDIDTATTVRFQPQSNSTVNGCVNAATAERSLTNTRASAPEVGEGSSDAGTGGEETGVETCNVAGIGWIVCPVSIFIAQITDAMYAVVEQLLVFDVGDKPFDTSPSNTLYTVWANVRNFANIAFIIAFFIIIFSQATSIGLGNYGIKKMLPRLIFAAVMVNISYYLCIFAIDISNILGAGFDGVIKSAVVGTGNADPNVFNLTDIMSSVLLVGVGGAAVAVGTIASPTIAAALLGLATTFGLAALFAIITALVILVGRQAFLIILIILAPLAFVAYILPNTENWFNRWRGIFTTLLVFYPLMAILFAGSQVAAMIMRNVNDSAFIEIFSIGVQAFPLFATPFILKWSGGLLGRIAGVVNNPNKGGLDRLKKMSDNKQEDMRNKGRAQAYRGEGNILQKATHNKAMRYGSEVRRKRAGREYAVKRGENEYQSDRIMNDDDYAVKAAGGEAVIGPKMIQDENGNMVENTTRSARIASTQAQALSQINAMRGEERKAGVELLEDENLSNPQWLDLQAYGKLRKRQWNPETEQMEVMTQMVDGKRKDVFEEDGRFSGAFYQNAALARMIPAVQEGGMVDLYKNIHTADASSRDTAYQQLAANYPKIKAKDHTFNDGVLLEKISQGIQITDLDLEAASGRALAGLKFETFAGQEAKEMERAFTGIKEGRIIGDDKASIIANANQVLSEPNLTGSYSQASKTQMEALKSLGATRDNSSGDSESKDTNSSSRQENGSSTNQNTEKPPPNTSGNSRQSSNQKPPQTDTAQQAKASANPPAYPQQSLTNYTVNDLKQMPISNIQMTINNAGGVSGMSNADLSKIAAATDGRSDIGDVSKVISSELSKREDAFSQLPGSSVAQRATNSPNAPSGDLKIPRNQEPNLPPGASGGYTGSVGESGLWTPNNDDR